MRLKIVLGFILLISSFLVEAKNFQDPVLIESNEIMLAEDTIQQIKKVERKHVRAKAIIFTIITGPLGGHRVYLRTRPGAPIIYALTLGGFGILPLVDLAHLIFKKDISSFEENPKIMMWSK